MGRSILGLEYYLTWFRFEMMSLLTVITEVTEVIRADLNLMG